MFEVKKDLLDSHEALLEVTVEEPTVQNAMRSAARQIARQVNIPGFRKGKAPYSVVVRFVGEGAVMQEAADNLLEELYPQFIESAEINPYASGELENVEINPMVFKIRVPLQPTVVLGNYADLRKPWEESTVSDDEIDMVLAQMREENALVEPIDRPAEMGDEVHVNIKGTVNGEVVVDEDDIHVVFSEDRPFLSKEFSEALLGISKEEERTFTIPLPDGMENEELRGADTEFVVTATEVSQRTLPGLDDAFASTVGAFETLEALKQDIYDRISQSKLQQAKEAYRSELVAMLVEPAEVQYPSIVVSEMLDDMVKETESRMQRDQQISLEDALRLEGRTVEQFREELTPQAEIRVKNSLVLAEFARQQEIIVTDDDVVQEYMSFFGSLNIPLKDDLPSLPLDSPFAQNIRNDVYGRQALERLEQIGRGLADAEKVAADTAAEYSGAASESGVVADSANAPAEDVVEEPVIEEPAVEEDVVEEPVIEEPAVEEDVVEEQVGEEPAVEEDVVEEQVGEEPESEAASEPLTDAETEPESEEAA